MFSLTVKKVDLTFEWFFFSFWFSWALPPFPPMFTKPWHQDRGRPGEQSVLTDRRHSQTQSSTQSRDRNSVSQTGIFSDYIHLWEGHGLNLFLWIFQIICTSKNFFFFKKKTVAPWSVKAFMKRFIPTICQIVLISNWNGQKKNHLFGYCAFL